MVRVYLAETFWNIYKYKNCKGESKNKWTLNMWLVWFPWSLDSCGHVTQAMVLRESFKGNAKPIFELRCSCHSSCQSQQPEQLKLETFMKLVYLESRGFPAIYVFNVYIQIILCRFPNVLKSLYQKPHPRCHLSLLPWHLSGKFRFSWLFSNEFQRTEAQKSWSKCGNPYISHQIRLDSYRHVKHPNVSDDLLFPRTITPTSHPIAFTCSFSTTLEKNDQSEDFALWENLSFSTRSKSRSAYGFGFIKLGFWSNNKYQICPSSFITYLPFALYKYITIIITNWPPVASVPKSSTSYVLYSPTFLRVKGVSKLNPQPVIFNQIITLSSTLQTQVLGFERLSRLATSYGRDTQQKCQYLGTKCTHWE